MSTNNNKGFSLLEVLVGVAIIGIISAIAIPQFADHRKNAAKVASNTSAANIAKAFQNCVVLNSFGNCDSLGKLKISCPAESNCDSGGASPKFCAHIKRGVAGQDDFNVCISVDATTGSIARTYGGALIGKAVCIKKCGATLSGAGTCTVGDLDVTTTTCTDNTDCTSFVVAAGANVNAITTDCKIPTTAGSCTKTTGVCN